MYSFDREMQINNVDMRKAYKRYQSKRGKLVGKLGTPEKLSSKKSVKEDISIHNI